LALAEDNSPPVVVCLLKPFAPEALLDSLHYAVSGVAFDQPSWRSRFDVCTELYAG
jgi:hypothetical protein